MTTMPADHSAQSEPIRLRSPADLILTIPYLLGFHPEDSLVLACFRNGQLSPVIRMDLPGPHGWLGSDGSLAKRFASHAQRHADAVFVLVYTNEAGADSDQLVQPAAVGNSPHRLQPRVRWRLIQHLHRELRRVGVLHIDSVLVHNMTWASYFEPDIPGQINTLDPTSEIESQMKMRDAFQGRQLLDNREQLVRSVEGPTGALATSRIEQIERYLGQVMSAKFGPLEFVSQPEPAAVPSTRESRCTTSEQRTNSEILADAMQSEHPLTLTTDERVHIIAHINDSMDRDELMLWCLRDRRADVLPLLIDLLAWTPTAHAAQIASVVALVAYRQGNGALAQVCLDRVFASDPNHRLAGLIVDIINSGMTPENLDRMVHSTFGEPSGSNLN